MSLLPVFLKLEGRPCLVVGAGEVATGKIESLVHSLARVTVVAPWARPEIVRLAEQRAITWHQREFLDSDIDGSFVIVAGTNHARVNQHVYRLAVEHNILCNAVDDPPHCDFYYGSVVARGKLQIAISTAGESPSVAQRLKTEIDALLPHDLGPWLCKLGALRREVLQAYPSGEDRKQLLAQLGRLPVCESPICPARDHAFPAASAPTQLNLDDHYRPGRSEGSAVALPGEPPYTHPATHFLAAGSLHNRPVGKVYLIGAGPGDPELLTLKAARLLASADVLLHDDLVPGSILALAHPHATILNVGKRCGTKSITQAGIHDLMIDGACRGLAVGRLKSGDPLVFGRANEEMDALRAANIPFEVVPGITAAFAAAAAIPCSLTDRRAASSILLSSGHHAATGDHADPDQQPTRAIYMPGRDLAALASDWRAEGLAPDLPCAVISRAAQPDQRVEHTTLAALPALQPGPAPVLVLAGSVLFHSVPINEAPANSHTADIATMERTRQESS